MNPECSCATDQTALERAKIAGETARHYGTMRFAMFTVFSAVLGALLSFAFSDAGARFLSIEMYRMGLSIAAFLLCVLFALAEYRISVLVSLYQEAAYKANALSEPPAHDYWKNVVLLTMVAPYLFAALFWVLLALGVIAIALPPAK
jgi:hypothetical protein